MKLKSSSRTHNNSSANTMYYSGNSKTPRPVTSNGNLYQSSNRKGFSQTKTSFPNIYSSTPSQRGSYRYSQDRPQPYWEREKLFDRCIKLQNSVNILDKKIRIAKIEQTKQQQEILKQNKILNEYNEKINNEENNKNNDDPFDVSSKEKKKNKKQPQYDITEQTLLSNIRIKYKELNHNYQEKESELKELKKTIKATKINEVQGEIDIYESEMVKMKTKLESAYEKIAIHEKKEKEYKLLNDKLKIKDKRIAFLQKENERIITSSDTKIESLEKELEKKNNKIAKLEREIRKMKEMNNEEQNNQNKDENKNETDKEKKEKEDEKEKQENKQENKKEEEEKKEDINNKEGGEEIEKKGDTENKDERDEQKDNNETSEENKFDEKSKDKKAEEKEPENEVLKKNKKLDENNKELYHLFIEVKKQGFNSPQDYAKKILKTITDTSTTESNKIEYAHYICETLKIETDEDKETIFTYINKFFDAVPIVNELKQKQIDYLTNTFNRTLFKDKELEDKINKVGKDKLREVFNNKDPKKKGFLSFKDMKETIKESGLGEIETELLILTKQENKFNTMNYQKIFEFLDEREKIEKDKIEEESSKKEAEEKEIQDPENTKEKAEIINEEEKQKKEENQKNNGDKKTEENEQNEEDKNNQENINKNQGIFTIEDEPKNEQKNEKNKINEDNQKKEEKKINEDNQHSEENKMNEENQQNKEKKENHLNKDQSPSIINNLKNENTDNQKDKEENKKKIKDEKIEKINQNVDNVQQNEQQNHTNNEKNNINEHNTIEKDKENERYKGIDNNSQIKGDDEAKDEKSKSFQKEKDDKSIIQEDNKKTNEIKELEPKKEQSNGDEEYDDFIIEESKENQEYKKLLDDKIKNHEENKQNQ